MDECLAREEREAAAAVVDAARAVGRESKGRMGSRMSSGREEGGAVETPPRVTRAKERGVGCWEVGAWAVNAGAVWAALGDTNKGEGLTLGKGERGESLLLL